MKTATLVKRAADGDKNALRKCAEMLRGDLASGAVVLEIVGPISKAWGVVGYKPRDNWEGVAAWWAQRLDAEAQNPGYGMERVEL